MKLLVVTLRPLNTRKFAKNATFHSSKFLKLKLSSHAINLCNFFPLNYTIFNCIKVICPRFSHILQFSVFLVLSVQFMFGVFQLFFFNFRANVQNLKLFLSLYLAWMCSSTGRICLEQGLPAWCNFFCISKDFLLAFDTLTFFQ